MMKRFVPLLVLFVFLLSACAGKDASQADPVAAPTEAPVIPVYLLPVERVIVHSASYTIVAEDPARALTELQVAVEKAGGIVSSASAYAGNGSAGYASLNAKVPPEALPVLSAALSKIADEVQNQSVYVQDVSAEVHRLQERHAALTKAREGLLVFLLDGKSLERFETFGILQELLDTELKAVEGELEGYEQQAKLGSFDVSINQTSAVNPPAIE